MLRLSDTLWINPNHIASVIYDSIAQSLRVYTVGDEKSIVLHGSEEAAMRQWLARHTTAVSGDMAPPLAPLYPDKEN